MRLATSTAALGQRNGRGRPPHSRMVMTSPAEVPVERKRGVDSPAVYASCGRLANARHGFPALLLKPFLRAILSVLGPISCPLTAFKEVLWPHGARWSSAS